MRGETSLLKIARMELMDKMDNILFKIEGNVSNHEKLIIRLDELVEQMDKKKLDKNK
jgi:hypothetical protein